MNPFSHIDLRVTDLESALPFYSKLLPALGFTRTHHDAEWMSFAAEDKSPRSAFFAITEDRGHKANANRIAFAADSTEEVDRLGAIVRESGARNIEGPAACPEYTPTYYAVFFEDPCGNKLEICYRED